MPMACPFSHTLWVYGAPEGRRWRGYVHSEEARPCCVHARPATLVELTLSWLLGGSSPVPCAGVPPP